MIKIVVMICHLMHAPLACTENTAAAVILADREDDGTPCVPLGRQLMKQLGVNIPPTDMAKVACMKDGKPLY